MAWFQVEKTKRIISSSAFIISYFFKHGAGRYDKNIYLRFQFKVAAYETFGLSILDKNFVEFFVDNENPRKWLLKFHKNLPADLPGDEIKKYFPCVLPSGSCFPKTNIKRSRGFKINLVFRVKEKFPDFQPFSRELKPSDCIYEITDEGVVIMPAQSLDEFGAYTGVS